MALSQHFLSTVNHSPWSNPHVHNDLDVKALIVDFLGSQNY